MRRLRWLSSADWLALVGWFSFLLTPDSRTGRYGTVACYALGGCDCVPSAVLDAASWGSWALGYKT